MAAPFRVEMRKGAPGETHEAFKAYLERLLKMIPGEVVGVYMIGSGFIPQGQTVGLLVWSAICLGLVVVVRIFGTADPSTGKPTQTIPVFVAAHPLDWSRS